MTTLAADIANLQVGTPLHAGDLTVYPLIRPATMPPTWITLGEALAEGLAGITEVSEGGSVPTLVFRNGSTQPVLLLDGEELVGAKQNRVLNLSILAPPMAEIRIPVSCIEQGRWHWRSRHFEAANRTLFASARAEKMAQVSRSMRAGGDYRSDQGAIWDSIQRKAANFEVHSDTGAASDIYEDRASALDRMVGEIGATPGQVGAAFVVRGRLTGAEVFGSAQTFATLLPKLVRSYGLDALDERTATRTPAAEPATSAAAAAADSSTAALVRRFLAKLAALPPLRRPAIGLGEDLRFEDPRLLGAALVHEEQIVHLSAFARNP